MTDKLSHTESLEEDVLDYKSPKLPIDERVADLMSRMTLEEKVAQLMGLWKGGIEDFKEEILIDPEKMKEIFGNGCNSIHPAPLCIKETVELRNKIQKYLI